MCAHTGYHRHTLTTQMWPTEHTKATVHAVAISCGAGTPVLATGL